MPGRDIGPGIRTISFEKDLLFHIGQWLGEPQSNDGNSSKGNLMQLLEVKRFWI